MNFLEKTRLLPERTRKIILWAVLVVLALVMLAWWIGRIPQRINEFRASAFIEQLDLPELSFPKLPALPDLNNIEINAQKTTSTQEN